MSEREPPDSRADGAQRVRLLGDVRNAAAARGDDSTPSPVGDGHARRPTLHEHDRRTTIHPHANAHDHDQGHDHEAAPPRPGGFPHEKLDAYRIAPELAGVAKRLAAEIPRGHRSLADHLLRAATNTVLLLAEGANRRGVGEKRQRFVESRGECGEAAAAADLALVMDLAEPADVEELKLLAARVAAMLTRLIGRLG